jgi:hypothetical protein
MTTEIRSTSPDGRFQVRVLAWEARNSLWVESPSIWDNVTDSPLLSFSSKMWSLDESVWLSDCAVQLTLRKYPGNHTPVHLLVKVDCRTRVALIDPGIHVALDQLEARLESRLTWL